MAKPKPKNKTPKKSAKKPKRHLSFRLNKKIKLPASAKVPRSWTMIRGTLYLLRGNLRLFLGILTVYVLLNVLLRGFDISSNFVEIKDNLDSLAGDIGKAEAAAGLYLYAIASSGAKTGGAAQAYQMFTTLIVGLATIWSARQLMAGKKIRVRDSFYQGMYPLIPFVLVLFVIGFQLLPALAGSFLLGTVLENGIAVTAIEKFLWIAVFALLVWLSLYMVSSSLFALYISALPDMTPMRALRSARELVRGRRLGIALRLLGGALFLLAVSIAAVVPLIFVASWAVEWVVMILGGFSLIFIHSYLYRLYRELL